MPSKDVVFPSDDSGPGFERCLQLAMLFGGDADTIMSMTGAIAGAYFGESAIPDYVRAHHMFSRILIFQFVIVLIRKLSFCQLQCVPSISTQFRFQFPTFLIVLSKSYICNFNLNGLT